MILERLSKEKTGILNHECDLERYIKTLKGESSRHFGAIQCDQGGSHDYDVVHACDHAVKLMKEELAEIRDLKRTIFAELEFKYGRMNEDFCVTMAGTVESLKKEEKDA